MLIVIISLILSFILLRFYFKHKFPKTVAITVFTGAVKSGKSAVSLACALSSYRKARFNYRIKKFFVKFFNGFRKVKKPLPEKPLFYSNIPLRVPYVQLTNDMLLRKVRFNYRSVVFIDEASLVADSQLIKDQVVNVELLKFFKLFGHETKGGKCIVNSQSLSDLHYALRRCTSQYFYIHHTSRFIPFVCACKMREERYSEDGSVINSYNEDVEDSLKSVWFSKRVFKKYDCFCFSVLTDNLSVSDNVVYLSKKDSLKISKITSFRKEFESIEVCKNEKNS